MLDPYQLAAFSDELQKIAAVSSKKKEQHSMGARVGAGFAGGAGGFFGGKTLGQIGAAVPGTMLMRESEHGRPKLDQHKFEALKGHMGVDKAVTHESTPWMRSVYAPSKTDASKLEHTAYKAHGINLKDAPHIRSDLGHGAVVAHELGHASNRQKGIWRLAQKMRGPGMLAGTVGATTLAAVGKKDSKAVDYGAPALAAAGVAPTLLEEGAASYKGYKGLKALGASAKELSHARGSLAKAWGTYGAMGAGAVAAPVIARAIKKRMLRDKK